MFNYKLYGLSVSSSRRISILNETDFSQANLTVSWNVSTSSTPNRTFDWKPVSSELLNKLPDIGLWETENQQGAFTKVRFSMKEIDELDFVLDSSKENLSVFYHEKMLEGDLESHFVGPALSFILRLRGLVCLHSSVVGIDDKAILFLGHATAGKSTIAAGMANAGGKVLADDIAVLIPRNDKFEVQSGYSKIRLRPKAAEFLTENADHLPKVYSYRESRYLSLQSGRNFHSESLPLAAIFVLGEISDDYKVPFIRPIESQDRLMNLIRNTSGSYVVMGNLRAKEFKALSKIAKTTPMRRLYYAHDIKTLPRQCEIIEEEVWKLGNGT